MRRPLVILPPLFYAARSQPRASGAARAFPGSVGLHGAVLTDVCRDLFGDLIRCGFRGVIVLNGHYENAGFLFEGIAAATEGRPEATAVLINWWEQLHDADLPRIFPHGFPGWEIEHAGIAETSLVEELYPELVREDRKTDDSGTRVLTYDVFPLPPDAVPPTGVPARSTPASRGIGRYIADALVERIDAILKRELGTDPSVAGADDGVSARGTAPAAAEDPEGARAGNLYPPSLTGQSAGPPCSRGGPADFHEVGSVNLANCYPFMEGPILLNQDNVVRFKVFCWLLFHVH